MKRQRGRGRKPGNNPNRSYESNGPDVKVRGAASHIADKYQQLARDAMSSGDRVMAENYYQHAEHYLRIVAANQANQASQPRRDDGDGDDGRQGRGRGDPRGDQGGRSNSGGRDDSDRDNNPRDAGRGEEERAAEAGDAEENGRGRRRRPRRRNDDRDTGARDDAPVGPSSSGDPLAMVTPEGVEGNAQPEQGFQPADGETHEKPRRRRPRRTAAADTEAEAALRDANSDSDSGDEGAAA
ncbi:MAG: DUF4167 domain-containing protein [Pseudomonadota bacterium]